ncbi:hypothetical protein ACFE04_002195 [Oxalis oulophora]
METPSPATAVEVVEKFEEGKDSGGLPFHCYLYDTEIVRKIAQMFLPGIASACVDNTSGDIFKTPASVAVDIRTEMVEYLTQRSESFIAESVILEGDAGPEVSDHPYDILSDFVDDYASSKRNLFSRVSGWLLSDKREDKIDDVVQEMEKNGFWLMDKREAVAQILLKNVDFKKEFHCDMKFNTEQELSDHVVSCGFRPINCTNEGCTAIFCASQMEKHDSVCPFKILSCEQKCPERLMRREMDKHCITVCPMKLVNCPFYAVGCESSIPYCQIEKHRLENLHSHVFYVLQGIYKGVSAEDLNRRVQQIEELNSLRLADARTSRSLTNAVKDLDAKLGPIEITIPEKEVEKDTEDEESKGVELKLEPTESGTTNKEDEESKGVEQKLEPSEISSRKKEDEESKGVELKLEPSEINTTNKEDEESKGVELKLEPSEINTRNKEVEKRAEDEQVKGNELMLESSEVSTENKEVKQEAANGQHSDRETQSEFTTVNKEVEKGAENDYIVKDLETKIESLEISTGNKEVEKEDENNDRFKDLEEKLEPSEISNGDKEAEKDTENDQVGDRSITNQEKGGADTRNSNGTKENEHGKDSIQTSTSRDDEKE